ncbi:uncharacterized protein SPPG_08627 [Spizellomyces punctatus DAOM BR117]|uniref:PH domain-containing protein n=1 Tax=Spizellomyces punctatus (strain DAOM BR117) TaxID=645134 RepID=A0A0L0H4A6_SPIPD|nr:uncharacterized protein SPPG_08627 [Spizellomyces punctatus DAOM BR117]KNC96032.1 hypothetical protein SPPG_08627 [Spizellomyces punctatus DAOM BR117]|eukprot:XP_016604072.1 hypothetical protein SPPG_08627 [Spizellomyces punctatus DAOM BR117]
MKSLTEVGADGLPALPAKVSPSSYTSPLASGGKPISPRNPLHPRWKENQAAGPNRLSLSRDSSIVNSSTTISSQSPATTVSNASQERPARCLAWSESGSPTGRCGSAPGRLMRKTVQSCGFEVDTDNIMMDEPKKKWVGLKRKVRYPIPHNLFMGKTSYSGYLTVHERHFHSKFNGAIGKSKRRWVVINNDTLYILKKPHALYASEIFHLEDCTLDPCPPKLGKFMTMVFGLYKLPDIDNEGRCFLFVTGSDGAKVEWMGEILRAMSWRERMLAQRGTIPRITVFDTSSCTQREPSQVFPIIPAVSDMRGRRWSVNTTLSPDEVEQLEVANNVRHERVSEGMPPAMKIDEARRTRSGTV